MNWYIPNTNAWLVEFIGNNWMGMWILYAIVRSIFPDSKVLKAIGEAFATRFPVFRGDK